MNLLEREVTIAQVLTWGGAQLYDEVEIRKWVGPSGRISLSDALGKPIGVSRIFWAFMRESVLPGDALHRLAVDLCRRFHSQLRDQEVYLDFRSARVLDAKLAWLRREISLGEYHHAWHKAIQARNDVAELNDARVSAGADAAVQAGGADPSYAVRSTFYTFQDVYKQKRDAAKIIQLVKQSLGDYESDKSSGGVEDGRQ